MCAIRVGMRGIDMTWSMPGLPRWWTVLDFGRIRGTWNRPRESMAARHASFGG
jgi:hypothetical protein